MTWTDVTYYIKDVPGGPFDLSKVPSEPEAGTKDDDKADPDNVQKREAASTNARRGSRRRRLLLGLLGGALVLATVSMFIGGGEGWDSLLRDVMTVF